MTVVIFGAGAIGCHIAYCLYETGHQVYLISRGNHFAQMKKNGLFLQINRNNSLIKSLTLKENKNFKILQDINELKSKKIDFIFITLKLKDYNKKCLNDVISIINKNTGLIPPCTSLPFWWLKSLEKKNKKKLSNYSPLNNKNAYSNINIENIIGMTMWLSAVVESPGKVIVWHVQRGYPLKEVFPKMKKKADILRKAFNKTCISPRVENIHAEIFTKSLNALAFNLVALDREFNNSQLKNDKKAIFDISQIMKEGEQITKLLNIKLSQSIQKRIEQTLSSTVHTMSMLNDFKRGKEIELKYLWESYKNVISSMNIKMEHTEFLIKKVLNKIN